ncbi:MAG: UTP--glucose-1-phosphate uridylyltransferase [Elusimicrobia bacterium]|nr:UTP--glucose-1-phosphate uridylyltransferase [Elusimicrobiota bacterium]
MIKLWASKQRKFYMKATAIVVAFSFLFSSLSAPYADASFWQERKKNVDEFKKKIEPMQLASLPLNLGGSGEINLDQKNFSSFSLNLAGRDGVDLNLDESLPKIQREAINKISQEHLGYLLEKIEEKRHGKKSLREFSTIPHKLRDEIQRYGEIVRVHFAQGKISNDLEGKIEVEAPLVIHIQDAHEIYSVQKNIASLLKGLMDSGVDLVGVEGSEGKLKGIEKYRRYPDQVTLLGLADYLLKQGLLTGVELAGLGRERAEVEFYGVEEKSKYLEQVNSFKKNLRKANEIEKWLKDLELEISFLKEKLYSSQMKELDVWKMQFKNGERNLGEWVRYLESHSTFHGSQGRKALGRILEDHRSHQKSKDPKDKRLQVEQGSSFFSNVQKFLKAWSQEKKLDFKKVEKEQQVLLMALSQKLSDQEITELLEVSLLTRLGKIEQSEFYSFLNEKLDQANLKINPELEKYIKYLVVVESIDKEQLFKELKKLEESFLKRAVSDRNPVQSLLLNLDQDFQLLETALEYKLSPEDYEQYKKREKEITKIDERIHEIFVKANLLEDSFFKETRNLSPELPYYDHHGRKMQKPFSAQPAWHMKKLMPFLKNAARFSLCSDQRNNIFVQKLMQRMEEKKCKVTVLVAGGYHSLGIENELKEKGISYLTIRPRMDISGSEREAHPLYSFKRELLPLEKLFLPEKISIPRSQGLGSGADFGFREVRDAIKGIFEVVGGVLSSSKENHTENREKIEPQWNSWIRRSGQKAEQMEYWKEKSMPKIRQMGNWKRRDVLKVEEQGNWQGEIYSAQVRYRGKIYRVWTPRKENDFLKKDLVQNPKATLKSLKLFKQKYKNLQSGETEIGDSFAIAEVEPNSNLILFLEARKFVKKGAVRFLKIAKTALLSAAFFTGAFGMGGGASGGSGSGGDSGGSGGSSGSGTGDGTENKEGAVRLFINQALENLSKLAVLYGLSDSQVMELCLELSQFESRRKWKNIPTLEERLIEMKQLSEKYGLTISQMYARLKLVKQMIERYKLFYEGVVKTYDHFPYTYSFNYEDLDYWADPEFSVAQLEREFNARSTIRHWANEIRYHIDSPTNLSPRDQLTYWADQLTLGERTSEQLKKYFSDIREGESSRYEYRLVFALKLKSMKGQYGISDTSRIRSIAEEYALFEPNPYAYSLTDKDITIYIGMGLSEYALRRKFEAMQKVREIARDKRYSIKDENGLSFLDLNYWAHRLNEGDYRDDTLADKFTELALLEDKANNFDLEWGIKYWMGELRTTPISRDFRPSRKEDVLDINELSDQERLELERLGVESLLKGEGTISMLAGGASSRMNPAEVPREVQSLINEMNYSRTNPIVTIRVPEIRSKAAVPIGKDQDGRVLTYLDIFGFNLFRLFEGLEREARGYENQELAYGAGAVWKNDIALINNWGYRAEHIRLIKANQGYGLKQKIRFFYAPLRIKFFAPVEDVQKAKGKFSEDTSHQRALDHAKAVQERFRAGDEDAIIFKGERDPWGHGDYFHELVRSGELLHMIDSKKRWAFVRNVDNSAAKFDKVWLELLGLFLKRELDFQPEVSPRSPGQKGGDLIVMTDTPNQDHQLAEHPNIEATYREKRITNPESSYWFNDAVAFFTPMYVINIYKRPEQNDQEFTEELRAALQQSKKGHKQLIDQIVERGRKKYPMIWDAKVAKRMNALTVRPENNMWQSTGIVEPHIRIQAVGVRGARNIPIVQYPHLSKPEKWQVLSSLRFLSTKGWTKTPAEFLDAKKKLTAAKLGKNVEELTEDEIEHILTNEEVWITLETYEGNKILINDLLEYILTADLVTPGILKLKEEITSNPPSGTPTLLPNPPPTSTPPSPPTPTPDPAPPLTPTLKPPLPSPPARISTQPDLGKKSNLPSLGLGIYFRSLAGVLIAWIKKIKNSNRTSSFIGFFAPFAAFGTILGFAPHGYAMNLSETLPQFILKPAQISPFPIDILVPLLIVIGVAVLGLALTFYFLKQIPQNQIKEVVTFSQEFLVREVRYSQDPKILNELKEFLKSEKTEKAVFPETPSDRISIAQIAGILELLSHKDAKGQAMVLSSLKRALPNAQFKILPAIKKSYLLEKMDRRIVMDVEEKSNLLNFIQWVQLFRAQASQAEQEKIRDAFIKGYGLARWATLSKEERLGEKKSIFDLKGIFLLDVSEPDSLWIQSVLEWLALGLKQGGLNELALSANSQKSLDKVKTFLSSRLEKEQLDRLIWILDEEGMDGRIRADYVLQELEKHGLGGRAVKIVTDNFDRWIESFNHQTLIKIIELVSATEGRVARNLQEITDDVKESLVLLIQQ